MKVVFKNCAPFTDCISEINNTQIDHAKDIDIVMSMYNLIEYRDNYSKTWESLWQYYRDEPILTVTAVLGNFPGNIDLCKYKQKITGSTGNESTKAVQIIVPLKKKFLENSWNAIN